MKKALLIFCLGTMAALSGWAQGAKSVPYSSPIGGASALDEGWTVIDANNDGKTWAFDNSSTGNYSQAGTTAGAKYSYHSSHDGNDWLISPAIHLEADQEYKVSFYVKAASSSYKERVRLVMASAADLQTLSQHSETLIDLDNVNWTTQTKQSRVFTSRAAGDYYFALYDYSPANAYNVFVTAFQVGLNVLTPGPVTELTAQEGANEALTVGLTWALPTVDEDGAALTSALTGVEVYRDGTLAATLPATATAWSDSEAQGLTAGFHTYEVVAVLGAAKSKPASVKTKYVGPVATQDLPYTADFSTKDAFDALFSQFKGEKSTQTATWNYTANSYSGNRIVLSTSRDKVEDEYLVTPPLNVTEPGAYKVTFNLSAGYYNAEKLEVLAGKQKTAEGLNIVGATLSNLSSSKTQYTAFVNIPDAGKYYVGLHACSDQVGSYGNTYTLYDLKVEKSRVLPLKATALKAVPAADMSNQVTLTWANPTKTNIGTDLTALTKVEVLRNGQVVNTLTTAAPGDTMTITDAVPAPGYYTYKVLPYNENGTAEETPDSVRTSWVGDNTQTLPYVFRFDDPDKWGFYTVVDANADGHTWGYNNGSRWSSGSASCNHSGMADYSKCDDWLLTPPFDLKPGYYRVSFRYNGRGTSLKVGLANNATSPATGFKELDDVDYVRESGYNNDTIVFKLDEGGKRWLAIQDYSYASSEGSPRLYITDIVFEATPVVPALATNLTGKAADDKSLQVTLNWTNPATTNISGVALESITKAVILRDGEAVGEVTEGLTPGATATFTDATIPQAGQYTYSVEIYNENGKSEFAAPTVTIDWVGGGRQLPYSVGTDDESETWRDWTIVNANGDSRSIAGEPYPNTWDASYSSIYYNSGQVAGDDWAMSSRLQFEAGTDVRITLESYVHDVEAPVTWDLCLAPALDHKQMTTLKTISTPQTANSALNSQTDYLLMHVVDAAEPQAVKALEGEVADTAVTVTAGVKVIGFHAIQAGELHVKSIRVEADTPATGVTTVTTEPVMAISTGSVNVAGATEVAIYDLAGRRVAATAGSALNISGMPAGVYVVTATVAGNRISTKIVK